MYRSSVQWLIVLIGFTASVLTVHAENLPNIQQRIDQFHEQRAKQGGAQLSVDDKAVMEAGAKAIAHQLPEPGLAVGSKAPDFVLKNALGQAVKLSDKLKQGPVVLIFYRGAWCPYCNLQLHALRESLLVFKKYNAQLIAVTPQTPDKSLQQVKKDNYPFEILSDLDDGVAKSYRLYFELPQEVHQLYKTKFKLDIEEYNGKGRLGLPVPGSYVIKPDGIIVAAFAQLDYKKRMEPSDILAALKQL